MCNTQTILHSKIFHFYFLIWYICTALQLFQACYLVILTQSENSLQHHLFALDKWVPGHLSPLMLKMATLQWHCVVGKSWQNYTSRYKWTMSSRHYFCSLNCNVIVSKAHNIMYFRNWKSMCNKYKEKKCICLLKATLLF